MEKKKRQTTKPKHPATQKAQQFTYMAEVLWCKGYDKYHADI